LENVWNPKLNCKSCPYGFGRKSWGWPIALLKGFEKNNDNNKHLPPIQFLQPAEKSKQKYPWRREGWKDYLMVNGGLI